MDTIVFSRMQREICSCDQFEDSLTWLHLDDDIITTRYLPFEFI